VHPLAFVDPVKNRSGEVPFDHDLISKPVYARNLLQFVYICDTIVSSFVVALQPSASATIDGNLVDVSYIYAGL
jgi:hypothetical protein